MTDDLARQRATEALDVSMALSAGAGTGKTTVLVRRVLALLAAGVAPGRVVATTFTEKAVGEVLGRARDRLEAAVADAPDDAVLAAALAAFGDLRVRTIHGFCRDLLDAEPLAAGWAPQVAIDGAADAFAAALRRWRRGLDAREPVVARLIRLVRPRLAEGAGRVAAFRDLGPVAVATPFDPVARHAAFVAVDVELRSAAARCLAPDSCKLIRKNEGLRRLLAEVVRAAPFEGLARVLLAAEKGDQRGGTAADWPDGSRQGMVDAIAGYRAERGKLLAHLHGAVARDLHAHFLPALDEAKAQAGVADFDDLLFRALALLESSPDARARLAARFDAILVDEVQDTDPIQARIAALLARDPLADGPWDAVAPRPGALFAVGDPKQSIYRFRRADVATWRALEAVVTRDGERHALVRSFRSVPGIVAWVNHTFAEMPGYEPLVATRGPAHLDPVVQIVPDGDQDDALVRHLLDLRARGARVAGDDGPRPMRWRDVMVLLPSWTRAEGVRQALEQSGIPALVEGGATFFGRDEVRLSIAALAAIDEPADAEAVVFALRGLFGFSHVDLADHKARGGSWRTTVPNPPPGPVADALAVLRDLHGERSRRGQVDLLDAVLEHTRAPVVWSLRGDGAARLANLDKLRALIREIEPTTRTPGEVVERLRALAADSGEEDLSRADVDADVVRVTSIFKAKGLEAPIVAIVHANRDHRGRGLAIDREAGALAVDLGKGLVPLDWDARKDAEALADAQERARRMYVAATRARDALVVVAPEDPKLANLLYATPIARGLAEPGPEPDAHVEIVPGVTVRVRRAEALPEAPVSREAFPGLDARVDAALAEPPAPSDDAVAVRRARVREAVRGAARASTRRASVHEVAMRSRVRGTGEGVGARGGTVVHAVMNRLDLSRPREALLAEAPGLVDALAHAAGLDGEDAAAVLAVVRRLLADPVLDLARAAPERWQEVPFAFVDKGRTVSGTIDLCFPTGGGRWTVVDWKSSVPPLGSPLRADYDRQLALYARALLATVGATGIDTKLVGPHAELGAPSAEDLAVDAVREELAAGLRALLDEGVGVPAVGADLDGVTVELAWPDRRVAAGLDLAPSDLEALATKGWTAASFATDAPGWPEALLAWCARTLGAAPTDA